MKLEAKIGWLYGFVAMILFSFNPITGVMSVFMLILIFILWCADINVKQRVEYYNNPEQLYKVGQNLQGADKIHELQLQAIPYTVKGLFLMVKIIVSLPLIMSTTLGTLLIIAEIKFTRQGYYNAVCVFDIIPDEYWFSIGIPLHIIATFFLFLMARSFWKRMDFFKKKIFGESGTKQKAMFTKAYEKLNMKKEIQPFEDGLRSKPLMGNYEWWYFDAKLKDGSSLVIVFHTGPIASFTYGFKPYVTFDLTKKGGLEIHREYHPKENDYSFAEDCCNARIGESVFKGDLNNYEIYYKDEEVEAIVSLKGKVPSWRPHTGHIFFNEKDYFAWLPSVPEGQVEVELRYKSEDYHYEGTGYHDHNWGNKPMFFMMHHWYWGRAKVGDYTIVSSFITANKKCDFSEIPIFMIAKDGKIIADDADNCLTYTETDYSFDEVTKKHVADTIIYDYKDDTHRYKITYCKNENIERMGMETQLTKWQYPIIWLIGLRGSYHRIGGDVTLEVYEGDKLVEELTAPAIYEQMYFGKDRKREL